MRRGAQLIAIWWHVDWQWWPKSIGIFSEIRQGMQQQTLRHLRIQWWNRNRQKEKGHTHRQPCNLRKILHSFTRKDASSYDRMFHSLRTRTKCLVWHELLTHWLRKDDDEHKRRVHLDLRQIWSACPRWETRTIHYKCIDKISLDVNQAVKMKDLRVFEGESCGVRIFERHGAKTRWRQRFIVFQTQSASCFEQLYP